MRELSLQEQGILIIAERINEEFAARELTGHMIWQLAGECLKRLIVPFNRLPIANALSECLIDYYCERYRNAA